MFERRREDRYEFLKAAWTTRDTATVIIAIVVGAVICYLFFGVWFPPM